jgi:TonB family protein
VLTPWNPVTWWQLRRLRTAMEIDCDRRVLSIEPDREQYGHSLLSVAARASGPSFGLAAFTERPLSLKRRIVAMTEKNSRWTPVRAAAFLALAMLIGVQACAVDSPVMVRDSGTISDEDTIERADGIVRERAADGEAQPEIDIPAPESPRSAVDLNAGPAFTPFTVAPSITNRTEVIEAMEAEYPPLLRGAGIGGTVRLYFFISAEGVVEDIRVDQSSGHPALDQAAMRVGGIYDFTPALNKDEQVPVWVSFPVTFQVR